jgi:hypothetical protein
MKGMCIQLRSPTIYLKDNSIYKESCGKFVGVLVGVLDGVLVCVSVGVLFGGLVDVRAACTVVAIYESIL